MVTIRTFIAIEVTATPELKNLVQRLPTVSSQLRVVSPEQLHITLKFLGDTDRKLVSDINRLVDESVAAFTAQAIEFHGLGAFPTRSRPSVLWVGLHPDEAIVALAKRLSDRLEPLGFEPESRPYRSHLTLARLKRARGRNAAVPAAVLELLSECETSSFGTVTLRRVCVYRSDFDRSSASRGPNYTVLHEAMAGV